MTLIVTWKCSGFGFGLFIYLFCFLLLPPFSVPIMANARKRDKKSRFPITGLMALGLQGAPRDKNSELKKSMIRLSKTISLAETICSWRPFSGCAFYLSESCGQWNSSNWLLHLDWNRQITGLWRAVHHESNSGEQTAVSTPETCGLWGEGEKQSFVNSSTSSESGIGGESSAVRRIKPVLSVGCTTVYNV